MKKIPLPLKKFIFQNKKTKWLLYLVVLALNIFASLFEGISFGFVFLALSTLNGNMISKDIAWLPSFFSSALSSLSQNRLFTVFLLGAVLLQVLRSVFTYSSQLLMTYVAARIQARLQRGTYERIFRLSYSCVSNYKIGDLEEYTKAPTVFISPLFDATNRMIASCFLALILLSLQCFLSVKLTLLVLGMITAVGLGQKFIVKHIAAHSQRHVSSIVEQSKETVQSLYGLKSVFSFNRQKQILSDLSAIINNTALETVKLFAWNYLVLPFNEIATVLLVGITLIVGVFFLEAGQVPLLATLVTFLTLTYRVSGRFHAVMGEIGTIARHYGSFARYLEIWDDKGKEFRREGETKCPSEWKKICLDNVSLIYFPKKEPALVNISCTIPKGKSIAFVGASGAGKSSLLDLIVRLYEPTQGKVYLDGNDLADYTLDSWLKKLGVVCQEAIIFNESVEANIRFGFMDASQREIEKAATIAGAHQFILRLPHEYRTIVGEKGFRLSGGEKQRIALARALLRDPEILILDEATSNLDSLSESLIQQAIDNLHGEKTIIIVAHRLSTIKNADTIIVLDKGQIIEQGTHQQLLTLQGKYHHYWNLQIESEISSLLEKKMPLILSSKAW